MFDPDITNVLLELRPGHIVEPDSIFRATLAPDERSHYPTALHFSARFVPPQAISHDGKGWLIYNSTADLTLSAGPSTAEEFVEGLKAEDFEVLYLGSLKRVYFLLTVQWRGSSALRIGLMTTEGPNLDYEMMLLETRWVRLE
jgi:hypothetical protein